MRPEEPHASRIRHSHSRARQLRSRSGSRRHGAAPAGSLPGAHPAPERRERRSESRLLERARERDGSRRRRRRPGDGERGGEGPYVPRRGVDAGAPRERWRAPRSDRRRERRRARRARRHGGLAHGGRGHPRPRLVVRGRRIATRGRLGARRADACRGWAAHGDLRRHGRRASRRAGIGRIHHAHRQRHPTERHHPRGRRSAADLARRRERRLHAEPRPLPRRAGGREHPLDRGARRRARRQRPGARTALSVIGGPRVRHRRPGGRADRGARGSLRGADPWPRHPPDPGELPRPHPARGRPAPRRARHRVDAGLSLRADLAR